MDPLSDFRFLQIALVYKLLQTGNFDVMHFLVNTTTERFTDQISEGYLQSMNDLTAEKSHEKQISAC